MMLPSFHPRHSTHLRPRCSLNCGIQSDNGSFGASHLSRSVLITAICVDEVVVVGWLGVFWSPAALSSVTRIDVTAGMGDLVIGKMDTMANEVEGDFEVS